MAIIGIDLGTTNSACCVWRDGQAELIPNRFGEYLTPSVVGLDDKGKVIFGKTAKERLINHSNKTVAVFKRLMGSDHKVQIGRQSFSPIELSGILLTALKEDAEAHLGETVDSAVISVPAYFNDNQRHATRAAGELAGLNVSRLINEPTAAAIAYGLHDQDGSTCLVLDMGGGTFDVSILEFFDGVMEVHSSAGDNFLGGEDFVEAMLNDLLNHFEIEKDSLHRDKLNQLYVQLETVKRQIDQAEDRQLRLDFGSRVEQFTVTTSWFEKLSTPLLLRAKQPIERALRDADMRSGDIDNIVLVGGSTRLKLFRAMVSRLFGRFPNVNIDPDLVVAMGAGVQAGLQARDAALEDIVLTDVCPYTLGTDVLGDDGKGGHFFPIIERNQTVPTSVVRRLYTTADKQDQMRVGIYQGEQRRVEKNVYLGSLTVKVPAKPRGQECVDVRYSYDMNGLLEVDVTVVSSQKTFNKVIENSPGALNTDDIKAARKRLAALKFHPRDTEENRALVARAERIYEMTLGDARNGIGQLIAQFEKVLDDQKPSEIKKAQQQFKAALDQLDTEEWL